jgi:hypothetical protein
MKKKLKKYQGNNSGSQVSTSKPNTTATKVKLVGFDLSPETVRKANSVDPKFNIDAKKVDARNYNPDKGFDITLDKKKLGGAIKKKKLGAVTKKKK